MRALDVGRGLGMKIQPGVAQNGVPAPANEKINNDENPDREVIDFRAHVSRLSCDQDLNESRLL